MIVWLLVGNWVCISYYFSYLLFYWFGLYETIGVEYDLTSGLYPFLLSSWFLLFSNITINIICIFIIKPNVRFYFFRTIWSICYILCLYCASYFEYFRYDFMVTILNWHDTSNSVTLRLKLNLLTDIISQIFYINLVLIVTFWFCSIFSQNIWKFWQVIISAYTKYCRLFGFIIVLFGYWYFFRTFLLACSIFFSLELIIFSIFYYLTIK